MNNTRPTDPGRARRPGFVLAERAFITLTLNTLRATPRTRCWWCHRPLTDGTCSTCDAEGVA